MEEEKKIILNLLLDKLFDEYKAENARKDTLESKALGFYTIIGIILADVIALQSAFKKIKIEGAVQKEWATLIIFKDKRILLC